jgi:hypothetical protein
MSSVSRSSSSKNDRRSYRIPARTPVPGCK